MRSINPCNFKDKSFVPSIKGTIIFGFLTSRSFQAATTLTLTYFSMLLTGQCQRTSILNTQEENTSTFPSVCGNRQSQHGDLQTSRVSPKLQAFINSILIMLPSRDLSATTDQECVPVAWTHFVTPCTKNMLLPFHQLVANSSNPTCKLSFPSLPRPFLRQRSYHGWRSIIYNMLMPL